MAKSIISKTIIDYLKRLIEEKLDITPEEAMHNLHNSGYSVIDCVTGVKIFFPKLTLHELCVMTINEFSDPLVEKSVLREALIEAGFEPSLVDEEIEKSYPNSKRYAVKIGKGLTAKSNSAYNVGTGDFTAEAWIKPDSCGGVVVARKPADGGLNNGGFLLVLKSTGSIKLATDDGMGFYEVNSEPVNAFDGKYHHVLGLRKGKELQIYFDFVKISVKERTDRFPQLNINNSRRLTIGFTDQYQEEFTPYSGFIGEIRLWNRVVIYPSHEDWFECGSDGLIGRWTFENKEGKDGSVTGNNIDVSGAEFDEMAI